MQEFTDEQVTVSTVWREALVIIWRYPLATIVPAAVLGMLGGAPYYFVKGSTSILEESLTFLTGAFAFYLYMTYAEEVTAEAEQGAERITARSVLHKLRRAAPVVPSVIVASIAAITIPTAATSLLVIPGLWLLTRWSLFAPAIVRERLWPVAALKRSNELTRNHFELVFHAGALAGLVVSGSDTWGQWIGGSIATTLITPLAALTASVAYIRLATHTI
jgi:hypothetical protein